MDKKLQVIILLALLIVPIGLSIWIKSFPFGLPAAEEWAERNVKAQYEQNVRTQYPYLPDKEVSMEARRRMDANPHEWQPAIPEMAKQYRNMMQDSTGQTYLLGIDAYKWMYYTENIVELGHEGTVINPNGKSNDTLMRGRVGKEINAQPHSRVAAWIAQTFNTTPMTAVFVIPLIISTMAIIPAFFIGLKLGGKFGAFITAMLVSIHPMTIHRTVAGFGDTDAWHFLIPLTIIFLLLYCENSKRLWKRITFYALTPCLLAFHSVIWSGYWYTLIIVLGTIGMTLLLHKKWWQAVLLPGLIYGLTIAWGAVWWKLMGAVNWTFGAIYTAKGVMKPLWFIQLKSIGASTWPNVLTTVAELNKISFIGLTNRLGFGLFYLALAGIIIAIIMTAKKQLNKETTDWKIPILLSLWFFSTLYASTESLRFIFLFVPAIGASLAYCAKWCLTYVPPWWEKHLKGLPIILMQLLIIIGFSIFLINPVVAGYWTAQRMSPGFDDAFMESMKYIDQNYPKETIIFSWWDFGHAFKAIARRPVLFDGGDQHERIYWMGRALITDEPEHSKGILRMLNCGQNQAYHSLMEQYNDTPLVVQALNEEVKKPNPQLPYTDCEDKYSSILVLSGDMVGKTLVFAHFGLWNFTSVEELGEGNSPWPGYNNGQCDPIHVCDSIFHRLFILDEDIPGFKKVYETNTITIGKIKLYEVIWDE